MINGFEEIQKLGRDNVDVALKTATEVGKGFQAIATETADYSKQSFEAGSAALEKLFGARSVEKAIEIQTAYFQSAYQGYVGQATKVGEIFAEMAKSAYRPYQTLFDRNGK
jgi:hypothetical protein